MSHYAESTSVPVERSRAQIEKEPRRLGHSSAAFTTDTYGHLLKGMQRTAAEAMDHLLA